MPPYSRFQRSPLTVWRVCFRSHHQFRWLFRVSLAQTDMGGRKAHGRKKSTPYCSTLIACLACFARARRYCQNKSPSQRTAASDDDTPICVSANRATSAMATPYEILGRRRKGGMSLVMMSHIAARIRKLANCPMKYPIIPLEIYSIDFIIWDLLGERIPHEGCDSQVAFLGSV